LATSQQKTSTRRGPFDLVMS